MKAFLIFALPLVVPLILAFVTSLINAEMNRSEKPAIKIFLVFTGMTIISCVYELHYVITMRHQISDMNLLVKILTFLACFASLVIGWMCLMVFKETWRSRGRPVVTNQNHEE
jgi:uncharacterized membrane protein